RLFRIDKEDFWHMMGNCPHIRQRVLSNMADRMKSLQILSFQREKLASLGTMAAGLAHELNNPASAAQRSAMRLAEALTQFNIHSTHMLKYAMFRQFDLHDPFPFQPLTDQIQPKLRLPPLIQSEREDELGTWLEDNFQLEDPWGIASSFAAVGLTQAFLEEFMDRLVPEHYGNFLNWTRQDIEMRLLSQGLQESTNRIAELIKALKSYSYMDRNTEKIKVDLHEGLDNTLIVMNHKLKKKDIKIIKEYDLNIPLLSAYGSELNQVWTNLIDNAIDAMPQKGSITLRTFQSQTTRQDVGVEIIDDGVGIPEEVQVRIFEPFFTTKKVGEGTGLGLEIAYRIIVNQHRGSIEVESIPGRTCFRVCLPLS
ncbi:MAG: hypothetical protein HC880_17375, partial [Bacteroidia bacterium]|nr:hypothetical protein [Bacteroidia bacterium]